MTDRRIWWLFGAACTFLIATVLTGVSAAAGHLPFAIPIGFGVACAILLIAVVLRALWRAGEGV